MIRFVDALTLDAAVTMTDRGLVTVAKAARTGVQLYLGSEVGRDDMQVVRVYRGADQVFDDASLQSYSHAPLTLDHPPELVTPDNWSKYAKGEVSTAAKKDIDGGWVHLPLIVKAKDAVDAIRDGKAQLSAGYTCNLDWTPGIAEDGQAYDARQVGIVINHLAIVDRARAGSEARIGDSAVFWGACPVTASDGAPNERSRHMTDKPMQKVVVDGLTIETTDQGAQALTKVQGQLADALTAVAKAQADAAKAVADAQAEIAAKDAEIDSLKAKVLDAAAMDAAVAKRADLLGKAKAIAPQVKLDGLSDAAIRKAVVVAKLGDAMADKPEAYIDARFDILAEDAAGQVQFAAALTNAAPVQGDADTARAKMIADMVSASTRAN